MKLRTIALLICLLPLLNTINAQVLTSGVQRISNGEGGFAGAGFGDRFGRSAAYLGDLNGDGMPEVAVGMPRAASLGGSPFGFDLGAVMVLSLDVDGSVENIVRIGAPVGTGGFGSFLDPQGEMGQSVCNVGDVDGDGITDLAAGAPFSAAGGGGRGTIWLMFLNADGTVKDEIAIDGEASGALNGIIPDNEQIGYSLACIGDANGDGTPDLAAAGPFNEALYILYLDAAGAVSSYVKHSAGAGDLSSVLSGTEFGFSMSEMGDLDGNGFTDLAVGARADADGGSFTGAVYLLFMGTGGSVLSTQKISATQGGFTAPIDALDNFGCGLANAGDMDGDGVQDMLAGAFGDIDGSGGVLSSYYKGAVYLLYMNNDGTVKSYTKFSEESGNFNGPLPAFGNWGYSVSAIGDLDGNGVTDFIGGAPSTDISSTGDEGAAWVVLLDDASNCINPYNLSEFFGTGFFQGFWHPTPSASMYQVQGRILGTSTWKSRIATSATFFTTQVVGGNAYEWRVRAKCADGSISAFSPIRNFAIPEPKSLNLDEVSISLFPNPANDILHLNNTIGGRMAFIYRLDGSLVKTANLSAVATQLDISELVEGIYFLRVGQQSLRFVKI